MTVKSTDFESVASANSAIWANCFFINAKCAKAVNDFLSFFLQ